MLNAKVRLVDTNNVDAESVVHESYRTSPFHLAVRLGRTLGQ